MTNTSYAFYQAKNITIQPGTKWETSTNAEHMFHQADGITIPDNTTFQAANMSTMFYGAKNIKFGSNVAIKGATNWTEIFRTATIAFPPDMVLDPRVTSGNYAFYQTTVTSWPKEVKFDHVVSAWAWFHESYSYLKAGLPPGLTFESATNLEYCFNNCRVYDEVAKKYQRLQHLPETLNLKSLSTGTNAFANCALSLKSVTIIADTIKDWTVNGGGTHNITIGILSSILNTDEVQEQVTRIRAKGWSVTTQSIGLL